MCDGKQEFDRAAKELIADVTRMIGEWERSDDLPSELAERLVCYFRNAFIKAEVKSKA